MNSTHGNSKVRNIKPEQLFFIGMLAGFMVFDIFLYFVNSARDIEIPGYLYFLFTAFIVFAPESAKPKVKA